MRSGTTPKRTGTSWPASTSTRPRVAASPTGPSSGRCWTRPASTRPPSRRPFSSEVVLSLFLGFLLPYVINLFYGSRRGSRKVARDGGDHIELLIAESIEEQKLIEITLRSRKSYVGFALESGVGMSGEADISLIPTMSGFRDKDTQDLEIVINYSQIIFEYIRESSDLSYEDFRIVIPISEIVSARLFIPAVYECFLEETPDGPQGVDGEDTQPPSTWES